MDSLGFHHFHGCLLPCVSLYSLRHGSTQGSKPAMLASAHATPPGSGNLLKSNKYRARHFLTVSLIYSFASHMWNSYSISTYLSCFYVERYSIWFFMTILWICLYALKLGHAKRPARPIPPFYAMILHVLMPAKRRDLLMGIVI
jgi:hypothetical protein